MSKYAVQKSGKGTKSGFDVVSGRGKGAAVVKHHDTQSEAMAHMRSLTKPKSGDDSSIEGEPVDDGESVPFDASTRFKKRS